MIIDYQKLIEREKSTMQEMRVLFDEMAASFTDNNGRNQRAQSMATVPVVKNNSIRANFQRIGPIKAPKEKKKAEVLKRENIAIQICRKAVKETSGKSKKFNAKLQKIYFDDFRVVNGILTPDVTQQNDRTASIERSNSNLGNRQIGAHSVVQPKQRHLRN